MQVTSDYYRCRAQHTAYSAESLILLEEPSSVAHMSLSTSNAPKPLRPSRRTLRCLENLYKSESQNRVA